MTLLTQFCIANVRTHRYQSPCQNLMFLPSTVRELLLVVKLQFGSRNHDPNMTPFDPIFHFFSLELTAARLRAKYEVSSFNRSQDIRGPKIPKIGSRDPT